MSAQDCQTTFYQQGDIGGRVRFDLVCTNVPLNTLVSFRAENPDPPISLPPTRVTTESTFVVGVGADLPANYESLFIYCAELPPGVKPPANMSIEFQALFAANK